MNYQCVALHTVTEGHVDENKFAVAGLVGAIFLKNLVDKTIRGMKAAVLAGRFAGGCAYGFDIRKIFDAKGERIRGYLDINAVNANVVERICRDFASGLPSIQIATALNADGTPGRVAMRGTPAAFALIRKRPPVS